MSMPCHSLFSIMCGYIHVDANMNLGGPAKVKCKKSMELYRDKAGPPIVKLFNFWHFTNKVALFHSLSNFKTQLKTFLFRQAIFTNLWV